MLKHLVERFMVSALVVGLAVVLLALFLIHPVMAQVVAAPATAPDVVQVQPILHDALMLVGIVVFALLPVIVQPVASAIAAHFHLKNADAVRSALTNLAWDAAHYGIAYADDQVTKVRGVSVGSPQVAAAANWLLSHACDEIQHLNLSNQEVIDTVKAILPQVQLAASPLLPAAAKLAS